MACAVVGDYLPHAAAMLASLTANGDESGLVVHLLHDASVPSQAQPALAGMLREMDASIEFHEIADDDIKGLPTDGFTGKGSWYRILLPDLVPTTDRILYLDVDLLVLDSITPLRDIDLSRAYVAAVTNVFMPVHRSRPLELGLPGPASYFNAGVLLMNLDAMRRDQMTCRLLEYGRANADKLYWRDQDALNVVLGEGRIPLPPRWNYMNSMVSLDESVTEFDPAELDEARRNPAIRHFEGPSLNKPWHYLADSEMQRLYLRYRRSTPWPRVDLDDRTLATRLIRRLPEHRRHRAYRRLLTWRERNLPSHARRTR